MGLAAAEFETSSVSATTWSAALGAATPSRLRGMCRTNADPLSAGKDDVATDSPFRDSIAWPREGGGGGVGDGIVGRRCIGLRRGGVERRGWASRSGHA